MHIEGIATILYPYKTLMKKLFYEALCKTQSSLGGLELPTFRLTV